MCRPNGLRSVYTSCIAISSLRLEKTQKERQKRGSYSEGEILEANQTRKNFNMKTGIRLRSQDWEHSHILAQNRKNSIEAPYRANSGGDTENEEVLVSPSPALKKSASLVW